MDETQKKIVSEALKLARESGIHPAQIDVDVRSEVAVVNERGKISEKDRKETLSWKALGVFQGKSGFAQGEGIDEKTPKKIVDGIKKAAAKGRPMGAEDFGKAGQRYGKSDTFSSKLSSLTSDNLRIVVEKLSKAFLSRYPKAREGNIREISARLVSGKETLVNSEGLKAEKKYDRILLAFDVSGEGEGARVIREFVEYKGIERIDSDALASKVAEELKASVDCSKAEKGESPVLLAPKAAATVLNLADLHLSGALVASGKSVYKEGLGKDVFSPLLIILNDPFIASSQATPFDREGNPTEKFMAVDHGRLRCFFLDAQSAKKLEIRSNGCATYGKPESQYFVVAPSAEKSASDLVKEMSEGYVVEAFDSEAVAKAKKEEDVNLSLPFRGYAVKKGEKSGAVKGVLKGRADHLLRDVSALSSEREDCPQEASLCPWFLIPDVQIEG